MYSTTKFDFCILVRTQNNDSFNKICSVQCALLATRTTNETCREQRGRRRDINGKECGADVVLSTMRAATASTMRSGIPFAAGVFLQGAHGPRPLAPRPQSTTVGAAHGRWEAGHLGMTLSPARNVCSMQGQFSVVGSSRSNSRLQGTCSRRHMSGPGGGEGSLAQSILGDQAVQKPVQSERGSGGGGGGGSGGRAKPASHPDNDVELYVTGVPHSWNRNQFQQLFEPLGAVSLAHLPHTFVEMQDGALHSFLFSCSHADSHHSILFFLALSNCCYADGCWSITAQQM